MASFSSGWLVITGAGGGLPSASLVLRRGGAWGESSLILYYCYFWLGRRRFGTCEVRILFC